MFKKNTPITAEEVFKGIFDISKKRISIEGGGGEIITRGQEFSSITIFRRDLEKKIISTYISYNKKCYMREVVIRDGSDDGDRNIIISYSEKGIDEVNIPFPPYLEA